MAGVALGDIHLRFAWQFVALGHIHLRFAWQVWHLWHWAGSGGALGALVAGDAAALRPPRDFAWQAWRLVTSTFRRAGAGRDSDGGGRCRVCSPAPYCVARLKSLLTSFKTFKTSEKPKIKDYFFYSFFVFL